jgi:hypothetical protein
MTVHAEDLIDPTARVRRQRPPAPGLPADTRGTIVLVDGMLNKASDWGRGILDAAEMTLAVTYEDATFRRLDLDPLSTAPADLWADSVAEVCDALVVTAGDCVTCTSRSARNAVAVEALGIPAVIICTAAVEDVVAAVCEIHGAETITRVLLHDSLFGLDREVIARTVRPSLAPLANALLRAR